MEKVVCADGRVRGMFQFYGANRTGRYSGRLLQPQNLPQNHMPDLDQARQLLRSGNYAALTILYDSVPEVLSELIRTAFIPKPGHQFIVADFSAIEARVIAWLAGEQWKMDVFAGDGKIYEATASRMFNVPVDKITKGSELRQKAKQAELACIAEGQLVLTDTGLVPIEKITKSHRLWDGESWVSHGGLIDKGLSEVIYYDGLTATPDHLVWIEGQLQPIQFGVAAALGAHLVQTGNGRDQIWLRDYCNCQNSGVKKAEELENYQRKTRLYDIRDAGRNHRFTVSGKLVHNCGYGGSVGALKAMGALEMGLAEEELQPLVTTWRAANPNIVRFLEGYGTHLSKRTDFRAGRRKRRLLQRKLQMDNHERTSPKQKEQSSCRFPAGKDDRSRTIRTEWNRRHNPSLSDIAWRDKRAFTTETGCYEPVYDLMNCGDLHRFTVLGNSGAFIVHNCVQAISRDILCHALQSLHHFNIVMHVHDEIVIEADTKMSVESPRLRLAIPLAREVSEDEYPALGRML